MKRKLRRWKMWGGYVDDQLNIEKNPGYPQPAIYVSQTIAHYFYDDVRSVEVRELPKRRRIKS